MTTPGLTALEYIPDHKSPALPEVEARLRAKLDESGQVAAYMLNPMPRYGEGMLKDVPDDGQRGWTVQVWIRMPRSPHSGDTYDLSGSVAEHRSDKGVYFTASFQTRDASYRGCNLNAALDFLATPS